MTREQFNFICATFGDSNVPPSERWKSLKYIYLEDPVIDVEVFLNSGRIMYVENDSIGDGFYILGTPQADFGVNNNERIITFIPLPVITRITLVSHKLDTTFGDDIDIDFTDEEQLNKFMINNMEEYDKLILTKDYLPNYLSEEEVMVII